ncbi:MAG: glucokinase [Verrucomicrobia bacterium RIFCSPHIGHO2_12_FULL_41_10]|nr:MAG: glucokinase [Verrucomicrobia bacterium RIFCSPHIGHO2_12_FULL_41_10]HLB33766.1 glucokinase [Chthoniobacterales bacterium]
MSQLILAGDLGGTNFRVALFRFVDEKSNQLERLRSERLHSTRFNSFQEAVQTFLNNGEIPGTIVTACFGVPGPNIGGIVHATNLNWLIDVAALPGLLGIPRVSILNDLEATALGIAELDHSDFFLLQAGAGSRAGNQCVIAPGTGLGEAGLFWDGHRHLPWASEGGHADFAPTDDIQMALLEFLHKEYGRVSFERVVAGMGITNIYRFLRDTGRGKENPAVATKMLTGDINAIIDHHSRDGSCSLCRDTMNIFTRILGAEAANLALKTMARGGVFLAGGIPPLILEHLQKPLFLESFLNKGRMRNLLASMPLSVVLNDETALLGSARCGARMLKNL